MDASILGRALAGQRRQAMPDRYRHHAFSEPNSFGGLQSDRPECEVARRQNIANSTPSCVIAFVTSASNQPSKSERSDA